jgi:predicted PurR-regulated permease PerM
MPDLLVMLTTLGGLVLFGASGIVIGPLIGALSITVWKLWGSAIDKARSTESREGAGELKPGPGAKTRP